MMMITPYETYEGHIKKCELKKVTLSSAMDANWETYSDNSSSPKRVNYLTALIYSLSDEFIRFTRILKRH